jgi:hypothetical protein
MVTSPTELGPENAALAENGSHEGRKWMKKRKQ